MGEPCHSLEIIRNHILYRHHRYHAAFPAIATRTDGSLLIVFRRARNAPWLNWASDCRQLPAVDHLDARSTLESLILGSDLSVRARRCLSPTLDAADQDASLLALENGSLLLAGFSWYPIAHGAPDGNNDTRAQAAPRGLPSRGLRVGKTQFVFWGGYTRRSEDGGETWSRHRWLPPLPGHPDIIPSTRPMLGGAVRGRPVSLGEGRLLLASYSGLPRSGTYASYLFKSDDHGHSWRFAGQIARDDEARIGYAEPCLYQASNERLFAFHRSFGLEDRLAVSVSDDLGRTWSRPEATQIIGHPCDVLPWTDSAALLVYGYRHAPYGIRACLWSPDSGLPSPSDEVILRADGPTPDLGYPWVTRLDRSHALVVYYFCDSEGVRHIAGTVLKVHSDRNRDTGRT